MENHEIVLNEKNFILYAAKNYNNINCLDEIEFYDDLKRFKYLKRLFKKYDEDKELKGNLIFNHLIIIFNVFDTTSANRMLFLKLKGYYSYLYPFLLYMETAQNKIINIDNDKNVIYGSDIKLDETVVKYLRELK